MKPFPNLLAISTVIAVLVPAALAGQDPEAIAARADRALAGLTSLQADFVQRVENPLLEKTEIGHGTLYYRAPGQYRIEYRYPPGDMVVDDGTWTWIYLPSSQPGQVIRQPADGAAGANPLTYLRDLRSLYAVTLVGPETVSGELSDHLALEPRSEEAPFTEVDVWVGRQTRLVRQVRTLTPDGVEKSYTFTALEHGVTIPETRFRFTPPRGVEIYDQ
jgi:outer membrane lipoprotein carrier protein